MPRLALLPLVLALPLSPRAEPPRAEGRIDSDRSQVEILGSPVRVGEKLELPEGFIRVEEQGTEDEQTGFFAVVPAESFAATGPVAPPADVALAGDPAPRLEAPPSCRAERAAYVAELWRQSGVEVSSPDALLEGLEGKEGGADAGFYWFALATDPFRPLAWSSSLRGRAEALARCVRGR